MGNNLSSKVVVDTSKDIFGGQDKINTIHMGLLWLLAIQGMAMIWATCLLVDRWRGPQGNRSVGFMSVLVAMIMSAAWPLVFVYLMFNR